MTLLRFLTAGVRVDAVCDDVDVANAVRDVGGPMLTADEAPSLATVLATTEDGALVVDGAPVSAAGETGRAAAALLSAVDHAALRLTPCLALHAAALSDGEVSVVVPAPSGTGKSTLAAAAMQRGLLLLSDEAACLRPEDGRLVSHPRPLGLSVRSRRMLGLGVAPGEPEDGELAVAPDLLGCSVGSGRAVPVRLVALLDRGAERTPAVTAAARAEGLAAVLESCLNSPAVAGRGFSPESAWRLLSDLVSGVTVVRLRFDDPHDGARLLHEALAECAPYPEAWQGVAKG